MIIVPGLAEAKPIVASNGDDTLTITLNASDIPEKGKAQVSGSYRAGLKAGSMSVFSRHNGVLIGTLSGDGKLHALLIGATETYPSQRTVKVVNATLVRKDGKWQLSNVKEDEKTAVKLQKAIDSFLK